MNLLLKISLEITVICSLYWNTIITIAAIGNCFYTEPKCPNKDVRFFLYTQMKQNDPHEISFFNMSSLNREHFIRTRPLIVLIHGYTGHKDFSPNTEIRPAYFEYGEYNIITVDYQPLARWPCYITAVQNLRTVANCTAQLLDELIERKIFRMKYIHIIGFSLGGQTAGMISTYIKQGPLERITGLDPAKPLFIFAPKEYKLDIGDAKFVDVIHTDVLQRGMLMPIGHVDFYVNGGVEQRGCTIRRVIDPGSCNHARAPEYYAESINSKIGFWGFRCAHWYLYALGMCKESESDSIALMGIHCKNS